ncbi:negative regulator of flagellin synthesis [Sporosarcina sp. NCCP-2222]|uniref:flagellar biosynthesis anti-sigma factor FlgM n=1 Tax=Sporosarcina sp. NCCP-2222 TaxID=2935073 RepID=UPI00207EA7F7|nr:flagellar biosynthesis anti-sigma factor FlgM [Sporosarcina sp. NCCP-2222]GKV56701.1 negative regulator of flagellin synthesis [Sporosarcina sp. NCCP-2222]
MKINKFNIPPVNPYRANQVKTDQAKEKATAKMDKIEISSKAKQLSETTPFEAKRNERVQQLKAQIESGEYQVEPEKLAADLIKYFKK